MSRLAVFIMLSALLLAQPAAAQNWLAPRYAPTAPDVDPGIDHTARDADLPPELRRTSVFYRSDYPSGTIIVNTADRYLYLIMGGNVALRYGIGVGRDGFQWGGIHRITRKLEWPDWTPPPEMITRQPYLPRFMAGGPGNPLGARALYIGTTVSVFAVNTDKLPVAADTSAAVVGFNLHFATLAKAEIMGLFKR